MNIGGSGRAATAHSARGHASLGGGGFQAVAAAECAPAAAGIRRRRWRRIPWRRRWRDFRGGGGGGGGRGGGGGGGRRSDIAVKHDVRLLGHIDNGLGFYRFSYNGSDKAYVGVIAQEVQAIRPDAVTRGADGTLRVRYDRIGVKFQTYDQWIGSGARVPVRAH